MYPVSSPFPDLPIFSSTLLTVQLGDWFSQLPKSKHHNTTYSALLMQAVIASSPFEKYLLTDLRRRRLDIL